MLPLLAALLALGPAGGPQEPPEPKEPPPRFTDPYAATAVALLPSYFQVHQPSLSDGFGATLVAQLRLSGDTFLEAGGRWLPGEAGGDDFDLGIATLGLSKVGGAHGTRFVLAGGAALLASGDLDDDVDFGVYAALQCDMQMPFDDVRASFRYEVVVPETDAGFGGRELELIQGFSLGLVILF